MTTTTADAPTRTRPVEPRVGIARGASTRVGCVDGPWRRPRPGPPARRHHRIRRPGVDGRPRPRLPLILLAAAIDPLVMTVRDRINVSRVKVVLGVYSLLVTLSDRAGLPRPAGHDQPDDRALGDGCRSSRGESCLGGHPAARGRGHDGVAAPRHARDSLVRGGVAGIDPEAIVELGPDAVDTRHHRHHASSRSSSSGSSAARRCSASACRCCRMARRQAACVKPGTRSRRAWATGCAGSSSSCSRSAS